MVPRHLGSATELASITLLHLVQHVRGFHGGRGAVLDAELHVNLFEVFVHRPRRQSQYFADVAVGLALGDPEQHFDLRWVSEKRWRSTSSSLR